MECAFPCCSLVPRMLGKCFVQAPGSASEARRIMFLLQLGVYGDALGDGVRHLVISAVWPRQGWRSAARDRMCELDSRLAPFVDSMRCALNGKESREDSLIEDLHNAVLRCCFGGLLGGDRKSTSCQDQLAAWELRQQSEISML